MGTVTIKNKLLDEHKVVKVWLGLNWWKELYGVQCSPCSDARLNLLSGFRSWVWAQRVHFNK